MQYQKQRRKEYRYRKTKEEKSPQNEEGEMDYKEPLGHQMISSSNVIFQQSPHQSQSPFKKDQYKTSISFVKSGEDIKNRFDITKLPGGENSISGLKVFLSNKLSDNNIDESPSKTNTIRSKVEKEISTRLLQAQKSQESLPPYKNTSSSLEKEIRVSGNFSQGGFIKNINFESESQTIRNLSKNGSKERKPSKGFNYTSEKIEAKQYTIPCIRKGSSFNYDENSSPDNNKLNGSRGKLIGKSQHSSGGKTITIRSRYGDTYQLSKEKLSNENSPSPVVNTEPQEKYNSVLNNTMSYNELKKVVNKFHKSYGAFKDKTGYLVNESQITLPGASDEVFNNRNRVISKMKKLSTILLSKRKRSPDYTLFGSRKNSMEVIDKNYEGSEGKRRSGDTKLKDNKGKRKFLYMTLAMMSSKGRNTEDRTILRRMRFEKGGVVDLAQEKIKKDKFKIKRFRKTSGYQRGGVHSQKNRERAAKLVQEWWRTLKDLYNKKLKQIILIQSVWKGRWVRKNIYDLLYLNYLYLSFCEKIQNILIRKLLLFAFSNLKKLQQSKQSYDKNKLKNIVLKKDNRRVSILKKFLNKWTLYNRVESFKLKKTKVLLHIRTEKEKKLGSLSKFFTVWRYIIKMENFRKKFEEETKTNQKKFEDKNTSIDENMKEKEKEKNKLNKKLKGLFYIIEGTNKYNKKNSFYNTLIPMKEYLTNFIIINKLKKIIKRKSSDTNVLLRKYLFLWNAKTISSKTYSQIELQNKKIQSIKAKIFKTIIETIHKKIEKDKLRKNFYKYYKNAMLISKEEDKDNYEKHLVIEIKEIESKNKEENLRKVAFKRDFDGNYLEGCNILQRFIWRTIHKPVLVCFQKKVCDNAYKHSLLRIIKIFENHKIDILKKTLNSWRNKTHKKIRNELISKLFLKIIKIISDNYRKKLLNKKLHQWEKNIYIISHKNIETLKKKFTQEFIEHLKSSITKNVGPNIMNRLKKNRDEKDTQKNLKNIIISLSKKNKNLLIKKIFDKWRNKVKENDILCLKGKLIFSLYDKFKIKKLKDVLNKYLNKWENNTLFFNKLNNELQKINERLNIEKTRKIKDTREIILKTIIRNLNRKINYDNLRKHFVNWKENNNKVEGKFCDMKIKLLKHNINISGPDLLNYLKKFREIDRRNNLLIKLINKKRKNQLIKLMKIVLKWKNKVYALQAANAYLPYLKKILAVLLIKNDKENLLKAFNMWKYGNKVNLSKMPYQVAIGVLKKILCRDIFKLFIRKMNYRNTKKLKPKGKKIVNILETICKTFPEKKFMNNLKLYLKIKKLNELIPKINQKIKEYLSKKYLKRWKDNVEKLKEKNKRLITNWLKNKVRDSNSVKNKKRRLLLLKFLKTKMNNNKYKMWYVFSLWSKITTLWADDYNAKIIQKFCRSKMKEIFDAITEKNEKLKNLLTVLFRKKFFLMLGHRMNKNIRKKIIENVNNKKKRDIKINKLKTIVLTRMEKGNNIILKIAFLRWKKITNLDKNKILLVQNSLRYLISKTKLEKNKKSKKLLNKFIKNKIQSDKNRCYYYFRRWQYNNKRLEKIENSKIIQNFCRINLKQRLHNKYVSFFKNLAKKRLLYYIKNNYKINNLSKILRNALLNGTFKKIRNSNEKDALKRLLIKILIYTNKLNNRQILNNYLKKWKNILCKERNAINFIQTFYRKYRLRNKNHLEKYRLFLLKKLLINNDTNKLLRVKFFRWHRKIKQLICLENAIIIQNFCRNMWDKLLKEKKERNINAYNNLATILSKIKVSPNDFFKRIKSFRKDTAIEKIIRYIMIKRNNTLKETNNEIKNYARCKKLLKLLHLLKDIRKRIKKNCFYRWKNNTLKQKFIMKILIKIINRLEKTNKKLLEYYFKRWLFLTEKKRMIEQANIIINFCRKKLSQNRAYNLWSKLCILLLNQKSRNNLKDILKNLKYIIALKKLKSLFKKIQCKNLFDKYKRNKIKNLIYDKLKILINKMTDKKRENQLRSIFTNWDTISKDKKNKENKIKSLIKILEKKRKKNATKYIEFSSIIKNLFDLIIKLKKLYYLRKLHTFYILITKPKQLSDDVIRAENDLIIKNRNPLIKKIYRIYAYKVLSNLFDNIEKLRDRNVIPFKKDFFSELYHIKIRKSDFEFKSEHHNSKLPQIKIKFRFKKKNLPKRGIFLTEKIVYNSVLPSFIEYLSTIEIIKKRDFFYRFRCIASGTEFSRLYKIFANKTELPDKKDLIDSLKYKYNQKLRGNSGLWRLRQLFFKKIIRKITRLIEDIGKWNKISKLIKMTITHKNIARDRWLSKLIRKWRFLTFVKIMATKKMELMYNNLHVSYREMADSIYEEDSMYNPGGYQYSGSLNMDKYLFNFDDPYLVKGAKLCKFVKRNYEFEPLDIEEKKKIEEIQKMKEYEISEESYTVEEELENNENENADEEEIEIKEEDEKYKRYKGEKISSRKYSKGFESKKKREIYEIKKESKNKESEPISRKKIFKQIKYYEKK